MSLFNVFIDRSVDRACLPSSLREGYGGDLSFPDAPDDRPYVFTNLVTTLDGIVAFGGQEESEGRLVSMRSSDDQWLMGLLRGAADAVLVGAQTVRMDYRHVWTTRALKSADADTVESWRTARGLPLHPTLCIVTATNIFPRETEVFKRNDLDIIILTTRKGSRARSLMPNPRVSVVNYNNGRMMDIVKNLCYLRTHFGIERLLCEGGPSLMSLLLANKLVDECFQTVSPQIAGRRRKQRDRLNLAEGLAWDPSDTPKFKLLSARCGTHDKDHLFLRYKVI